MSNRELWEGFVSAAQRKAVWASKADGGKGHPDNKKKKSKKEDVATEEGYSSYAQQKAVWASRADKKKGKTEDSDAVKAFLAKGGKIKKLPPAKAQGYHGKDDPGKGVHGVMDKPDTDKFKTKKKVKSMEGKTFDNLRSQLLERSKGDV